MNKAAAFAKPHLGGWFGYFRLDWRSEVFIVREHRDGPVCHFRTAAEAECAAWRAKDKIERPHMRRDGETLSSARLEAEALFKPKEVAHG